MQPARSCFLPLLALAIVTGCGGDAGPRIDSLGEGPTNEKPLWVPRPGPLGPTRVDGGGSSYAMSAERMIDGRRVFLAGWHAATLESGFGPAEPYLTRIYGRHDDGIYLEGDLRAGLYDEPVLFVPSTVRVGMRWSHPPRWSFEVISLRATTPPSWVIRVTDKERRITNRENTSVIKGDPYDLTYYEGSPVGPFAGGVTDSFNELLTPRSWLGQDDPPPPAAPIDVPKLELDALNDGDPIAEQAAVPTYFGAVVDADGDRVDLVVDGVVPFFHPAGVFVGVPGSGCQQYSRALDAMVEVDAKECRDARGTIIDRDGRALRIGNDGWRPSVDCVPGIGTDGSATCNPVDFYVAGIYRAEDGTAMVMRGGRYSDVGPHDGDESEPMSGDEPGSYTGLNTIVAAPEIGGALWIPEPDDDGWSVLAVYADGLKTLHLRPDGEVDALHSFRDEGGVIGLTSDASGRRYLRTHPDGLIERLVWDKGGVRVHPLATIGLAQGRVLVGAVELEDRLLVLTLHGFEGTDPQYRTRGHLGSDIDVGADRRVRPEVGELRLWEAELPPDPGPPIEAGELTRIAAAMDENGADAAVCNFTGTPSLRDWTVAGAPAIAFANSERCITIVGDKVRVKGPLGFMRGSLPALGKFSWSLEVAENTWPEAFYGDNPFTGAVMFADGSGFAVCKSTSEDGACLAWRLFDRDWNETAEDAESAPPLMPLPEPQSCTTLAGASCSVHSLAVLDCRGEGSPGQRILPDFGVSRHWQVEGCWPVGDTIWMALHQVREDGDRESLWRIDTRAWTFEPVPIDAAGRGSDTLTPEGDPVLVFHDPPVFVKLKEDHLEHFNVPGGGDFAGPLLLGRDRIWRRDGPFADLSECGDGVRDPGEHCPEDASCAPGARRCITEAGAELLETCHDDGESHALTDCTTVCDISSQSCHGSGEVCHVDACVPAVLCGAVRCEAGEVCDTSDGAPRCAVLPRCGDGLCQAEEDEDTCADCANTRDGACAWSELWSNDCSVCGDGRCNSGISPGYVEAVTCAEDCVGCGDGVCAPGEVDRCPYDCPSCGNSLCESWERDDFHPDYDPCPADCLPCEVGRPGCFREGVVTCDAQGAPDAYTPCATDELCEAGACVPGGVCGNGRCEEGETATCSDCSVSP